jgi:hypothetical protein
MMIHVNGRPPASPYWGSMTSRTKWSFILGAVIVAIFGYAFYINLV